MSAVSSLLARLQKTKEHAGGKWTACCPAHEDRAPSLAIRELPDGRVLVHCFAGCAPLDVLNAVGLEFSDLYPEPLNHHLPPAEKREQRLQWAAMEMLKWLDEEAWIVAFLIEQFAGRGEDRDLCDRAQLAAARIRRATRLSGAQ